MSTGDDFVRPDLLVTALAHIVRDDFGLKMQRVSAVFANCQRPALPVNADNTRKTSLDRGRTDRISLTHDLNLDL